MVVITSYKHLQQSASIPYLDEDFFLDEQKNKHNRNIHQPQLDDSMNVKKRPITSTPEEHSLKTLHSIFFSNFQ